MLITFEWEILKNADFHSVKTCLLLLLLQVESENKAARVLYSKETKATVTWMLFFNAGDGYAEAIVRGYKMGLLTTSQYSSLSQCENLDGKHESESFGLFLTL